MNSVEHVQAASFGQGHPGPAPPPSLAPGRLTAAQSAVLDVLAAQPHPLGIVQLSELTKLHSNTIREHLDVLVEAGLVSRTTASRHGPGRPSWQYRAAPLPAANQNTDLALALAGELARQAPDAVEAAIQAGWHWGTEHNPVERDRQSGTETGMGKDGVDSSVAQIMENLRQLGFDPELASNNSGSANDPGTDKDSSASNDSGAANDPGAPDEADGQIQIRLRCCPMLAAAKAHPEVTCNVHLGLVQGWLDQMAKGGPQSDEAGGPAPGLTPGMRAFAESDYCLLTLSVTGVHP